MIWEVVDEGKRATANERKKMKDSEGARSRRCLEHIGEWPPSSAQPGWLEEKPKTAKNRGIQMAPPL